MAKIGQIPELGRGIPKSRTGIPGLDDVTMGGFPRGRTTLLVGGPGTGKTLLGATFAAKGAAEFGEPAVIMTFEETAKELTANVRSLGFNLDRLIAARKLVLDYVRVERQEIEETGEYDLEGLFIRLDQAIKSIKARRVVLDTIESLFGGLPNASILRAELRRLFRWLKDRGMTTVITAESGQRNLTREGLEEYVSDCVILLDNRMESEIATRRLRILKYRGSIHGTNEYPFVISDHGISVLPITSLGYSERPATKERISSGIPRLDAMLGGKGYYRGSTVLVSGTAGTGKTTICAKFAEAACRRGERCLYFAFEEPGSQIIRNMRAVGIDLAAPLGKGLLKFESVRPTLHGLELHLLSMQDMINQFHPRVIVMDPITNLSSVGDIREVMAMLTQFIGFVKNQAITAVFTALTEGGESLEKTGVGVSSMADTWLLLRDIEIGGERNRAMYVLKSRGMAHSNQIREFVLSRKGVDLLDVYVGPGGVLTGSMRMSQEARERQERLEQNREAGRLRVAVERKRSAMEAEVKRIKTQFAEEEAELKKRIRNGAERRDTEDKDRKAMAVSRQADKSGPGRAAR